MVAVQGATLAGLAAAARLARLGHDVTLHTGGDPLGGRWSTAMPSVIVLPAAWRDLFKKTGRALDPELAKVGLRLMEAPPARHRFDDGTELELPTERGAQYHALAARYGPAAGGRWRDVLDGADDAWAAARRHGVESPDRPRGATGTRALWLDRTLANLADRVDEPHLARILLDLRFPAGTSSPKAPAFLTTRLAVERTFGRWQLVDEQGRPQPASRLVSLLVARLRDRGVRLVDEDVAEPDIDCRPHRPRPSWWRPGPPAAEAPWVSVTEGVGASTAGIVEEIDHSSSRPVLTWARPGEALVWDYGTTRRDLAWGLAPRRAADVLARPPVDDGGLLRASCCSPAGPEPWAELSSAALAVYELHERLTGEDCRPTNRDFRPPRLRTAGPAAARMRGRQEVVD
ncbi:MAG TPA: FAD-dependent oxidoreductase [Arachnia sp.]|nr:FAD-dependent oxidoreductase [Arachnia sp.]HMT86325.1 FAD-dependent oxidoreductase [Arachnia sp.]